MSSTTTTGDVQAVRAVIDAVSEAWAAGDAEAFAGHYAEEATAVLPGFALLSRAVIRTAMAAAFAGQLKGTRRVHRVQGVRFLDDATAMVITRSATVPAGDADPAAGAWSIATWALSGRSGRWLVEAYHDCPAA
jgi:uncharacterized protein (TIGR02246 family)